MLSAIPVNRYRVLQFAITVLYPRQDLNLHDRNGQKIFLPTTVFTAIRFRMFGVWTLPQPYP
jgi:hypothetical protein